MKNYLAILLALISFNTFAYETTVDELPSDVARCYAASMIGFDSVINSRVGVLPEHAIELTSGHSSFDKDNPLHRDNLRITIWTAYLWKDSPHTYAVETFAKCIKDSK